MKRNYRRGYLIMGTIMGTIAVFIGLVVVLPLVTVGLGETANRWKEIGILIGLFILVPIVLVLLIVVGYGVHRLAGLIGGQSQTPRKD